MDLIDKKCDLPYLPDGREINYVDISNRYMKEAMNMAKTRSTDKLQPTGSVVVKDGQIIGMAANKVPFSNPYLIEIHRKGLCVRKIFKVKSGQKYWLCPGCAKYKDHSEQRAIVDAQKKDFEVPGADLYLWGHWWCCEPCWKKIIEAGIKNVYLLKDSDIFFRRESKQNTLGKIM